jgi:hypothetical protein
MKWTKEKVFREALKYQKREDWKNNSSGSHNAAQRNGWLKEASKHMQVFKKYNKWSKKQALAEGKKYRSRSEWQRNSPTSYAVSLKNGWNSELVDHFSRYKISSSPQIEILSGLQKLYPGARSKRFVADKNFPFKSLEIDVYIPELKKGIEFDGKYWHSIEGLKRSHPFVSEEILDKYHDIKDSFFKEKGIEVLHIREENWIRNKLKCFSQIYNFLGVTNASDC